MVTPSRLLEGTSVSTPSVGTLYTAPVNQTVLIKKLTFTNSTNAAIVLNVYLPPAAGAAGGTNVIRANRTLGPYETYECFEAENHALAAGDFLAAGAGATGVTAHASGLLIT